MRIDLVGTTADFRRFGPPRPLQVNHLPCENCAMLGRIGEVGLMRLEVLQQTVGLNVAEVAGMSIPKESLPQVALCTADIGAFKEDGIESRPHAQRSVS